MFHIIARARKDAKALQYINERNYGGFLKVSSLGGGRRFDEVGEILDELLEHPYVPILFFGEKESSLVGEILPVLRESGRPFYARLLRTKRVRNTRVGELLGNLEEIKARFRLGFGWEDGYFLDPMNPMGIEIHSDYDAYLALGEGFRRAMKELLDVDLGKNALVLRKLMNREVYYSGLYSVTEVDKRLGYPTEVLWRIPHRKDAP